MAPIVSGGTKVGKWAAGQGFAVYFKAKLI